MSKIRDDEFGRWTKNIVNPDETLERSSNIIKYVSNEMKSFDTEKRIITSMSISVNYCNTDESVASDINSQIDRVNKLLEDGLLVWETSELTTGGDHTVIFKDDGLTMRDRVIHYMDVVVSRGMMNSYQYLRFADTITSIYKIFTGRNEVTENINFILENMNLDYGLKYYPATVACPDEFFKLIRYDTVSTMVNNNVSDSIRDAVDTFMKKWFNNGNSKIYDKDRDEFYTQFSSMYESIVNNNSSNEKDGVITPARRNRSKKVMAMKPLMNYSDINKILDKLGLNYHISYQQETDKSGNETKRRNSLSLKG